jgi:hypothetical protein
MSLIGRGPYHGQGAGHVGLILTSKEVGAVLKAISLGELPSDADTLLRLAKLDEGVTQRKQGISIEKFFPYYA